MIGKCEACEHGVPIEDSGEHRVGNKDGYTWLIRCEAAPQLLNLAIEKLTRERDDARTKLAESRALHDKRDKSSVEKIQQWKGLNMQLDAAKLVIKKQIQGRNEIIEECVRRVYTSPTLSPVLKRVVATVLRGDGT